MVVAHALTVVIPTLGLIRLTRMNRIHIPRVSRRTGYLTLQSTLNEQRQDMVRVRVRVRMS
jgi:hypothetical protein